MIRTIFDTQREKKIHFNLHVKRSLQTLINKNKKILKCVGNQFGTPVIFH